MFSSSSTSSTPTITQAKSKKHLESLPNMTPAMETVYVTVSSTGPAHFNSQDVRFPEERRKCLWCVGDLEDPCLEFDEPELIPWKQKERARKAAEREASRPSADSPDVSPDSPESPPDSSAADPVLSLNSEEMSPEARTRCTRRT